MHDTFTGICSFWFFFFNLTFGGIISFFDRAGVFVKLTVIMVLPGKSSGLMY